MMNLFVKNSINAKCPWSGKAVKRDSLVMYREKVVGFASEHLKDKWVTATSVFDRLIEDAKKSDATIKSLNNLLV